MINSFGYTVMSLDEVIEALTLARHSNPSLGQQPVWVRTHDLYRPIRDVSISGTGRLIVHIVL